MSGLARRVLTGTTLAVVVAGLMWLNTRLPQGLVALVVAVALAQASAWELDRMGGFRGRGFGVPLLVSILALLLLEASFVFTGHARPSSPLQRMAWHYGLCVSASAPAALLTPFLVPGGNRPRPPWSAVALATWLVPPLFALVVVDEAFGITGLIALVVLAKVGDNAGYFVGRSIGKRHPFPRISPGKTVAGCVASLVAGIVTGAVVLPLTIGGRSGAQVALGGLMGGLVNVAAQASDLSESWVKRRAGVKDSSALLGASGGVLDVIDSLFLAAPVALVLWTSVYYAPMV